MKPVTILCASDNSNYFKIPFLNIYTARRNAYTYTGNDLVICHPPCAQWGRLRQFANVDLPIKNLGLFCLEMVMRNGGILEHPVSSLLWNEVDRSKVTLLKVNQSWWGFPARKPTILLFHKVQPIQLPMNFNAITHTVAESRRKHNKLKVLYKKHGAQTTLYFNSWLVECCRTTETGTQTDTTAAGS